MMEVICDPKKAIHVKDVTPRTLVVAVDHKGDVLSKLHRVCEDKYAFVSLRDSTCYADGVHDDMTEAILSLSKLRKIYVLEDLSELKRFL